MATDNAQRVSEITASSIFVKSKLPDADYVANPYTGCAFGCQYCYASFMGRFVDEPIGSWGDYVYVKINAVELAAQELARWSEDRRRATILLSSVTDPYQGVESKYRLARGILSELVNARYPGLISILTKSPLVERDIDVLTSLPNAEVGLTVTTTDDRISRWLELRAPLASRRLQTLKSLADSGVSTYAFVGPLLPHYRQAPELLDELFAGIAATGTRQVFVEHINLKQYIRQRMDPLLATEPQGVQNIYLDARSSEHRRALDDVVEELLVKHNLTLRLSEVLYHNAPGGKRLPRTE